MRFSQKIWRIYSTTIVLTILDIILCVFTFFGGDRVFFSLAIILTIATLFFVFWRLFRGHQKMVLHLGDMFAALSLSQQEDLEKFPLPFMVISGEEEILWYNALFQDQVSGEANYLGQKFSAVFALSLEKVCASRGFSFAWKDHFYEVYGEKRLHNGAVTYLLFFWDNTYFKEMEQRYLRVRPAVLHIVIDNYEEVFQNSKDSDRARISGQIEAVFERFISENQGLLKRLNRDKYLAIIEEQFLDQIIKGKFQILNEVRSIALNERIGLTLSIGVGHKGKSYVDSDEMAKQAVEMALGRGGDQAAVRTDNGYDFYGGVSQGMEKRTKVKTRIIASAMLDIIKGADNCIVMGHRFADLDCFGSAIGLATAIRRLGKDTVIAIDPKNNLVGNFMGQMQKNGYADLFVSPEDCLPKIGRKTLLFITDTHVVPMLESQKIYEKCGGNVIVIDHHRRMVGYIDSALIFFHEPFASSASEMVTELIQYFGDAGMPSALEAEALLAGITLDTKNFVLKTGVRTFEAAAYLRKYGADTVAVKKLFSSSMDSYQKKAQVVSESILYKECAIAASSYHSADMRIVAPQAADELLTIAGVHASFVLYPAGDKVQISARSMGEMNVQIVMEHLGGGGHLTMAGAALALPLSEAVEKLKSAIDTYFAEQLKKEEKLPS